MCQNKEGSAKQPIMPTTISVFLVHFLIKLESESHIRPIIISLNRTFRARRDYKSSTMQQWCAIVRPHHISTPSHPNIAPPSTDNNSVRTRTHRLPTLVQEKESIMANVRAYIEIARGGNS